MNPSATGAEQIVLLEQLWKSFVANLPAIVIPLLLLLIGIFLGTRLRRLIQRSLRRGGEDTILSIFLSVAGQWLVVVLAFVIALNLLGYAGIAASLLTSAGVVALIVGLGLRDIIENFLGGIVLAFQRPFGVGDIVQTREFTGTVKALRLRYTHIRSFDEKDIYIPNAMIIKEPLINWTNDGLLRFDFGIGVDYNSPLPEVRELIATTAAQVDGVLKDRPPFISIDEFAPSTINLRVHFWMDITRYQDYLELEFQVMQAVYAAMRAAGHRLPANVTELMQYEGAPPIRIAVEQTGTPPPL